MTDDSCLASLLARTDLTFRPVRGVLDCQTEQARRAFQWHGLPLPGNVTPTIKRLASRGLLTLFPKPKSYRFTEAGDVLARAICGLPSVRAAWWYLSQLTTDGTSEDSLCDASDEGRQSLALQLAPLLCRGSVLSRWSDEHLVYELNRGAVKLWQSQPPAESTGEYVAAARAAYDKLTA